MSIKPSASQGEQRPNTEPFPPRGGHDNPCAYASGMSSNCTCSEPQPIPLSPEREAQFRALLESGEALSPNAGWALLAELDRTRAELAEVRESLADQKRTTDYFAQQSTRRLADLQDVKAERDELKKRVTHAVHALKTPAPSGSQHYRSGWDDGVDAAIDAARDAFDGGDL
jgi:hypothetical protein